MDKLTSSAVMAQRVQPKGSLDYFPTAPWATRAVIEEVFLRFGIILAGKRVREPCAGGGHMVHPLREYFAAVDFSDVADWGIDPEIRDFCLESSGRLIEDGHQVPDWIFCNPPFEISATFFERAIAIATEGVAFFCRLGWLTSQGRYEVIFSQFPLTILCPFAERVALIEAAWDPEASTATDYAWFIWIKGEHPQPVWHLPPGMQKRYTRASDAPFANRGEAARRAKARKEAAEAAAGKLAMPSLFDEVA